MRKDVVLDRILTEPLTVERQWAKQIREAANGSPTAHFEPVDSILWKLGLSRYYRREGHRLLANVEEAMSPRPEAVEEYKLKVEAYVIGYAHAVHSLFDLTLQVINVVILNKVLLQDKVTWNAMKPQLEKGGKTTHKIRQTITSLTDSKEWKYLHEFVNTIKHRRAMPSGRLFSRLEPSNNPFGFMGLYLCSIAVPGQTTDHLQVHLFFEDRGEPVIKMIDLVCETIAEELKVTP